MRFCSYAAVFVSIYDCFGIEVTRVQGIWRKGYVLLLLYPQDF